MNRLTLMAAIAALLLLNACGKSNISWNEEVQINGGEIILVKRTAKTKAFGEIGGPGGWENEGMTVEVIKPELKDKPPIWNFPFVPLLFDQDAKTKQWFMVATFYSCTSWYDLGRPALPYTEYRLIDGKWIQKPLSQEVIGRPANMLTSVRSSGEPDHTIGSKTSAMGDTRITKKYLIILDKWSTGC
jgi:hypothetical protein